MTYYKKLPVLDATEQAEFDNYLKDEYIRDFALSQQIVEASSMPSDSEPAILAVFDKLATPRIYLLQDWIHRRQQEKAGVLSETGEAAEAEKK